MIRSFLALVFVISLTISSQAQDIKPTEDKALFKILVLKMDGSPRANNKVAFVDEAADKTYEGETDAEGKFKILLPKNINYKVYSEIFGNIQKIQEVQVPDMVGLLTFNMKLEYDMSGWDINLDGIEFDTGKSTLRKESYTVLNEAYEFLAASPTMKVEIQGHTDDVGTEESNQKLSDDRARVVMEYLIKKGISKDRLVSKGYGESEPLTTETDAASRQKNRRTVFKIVSE